MCGPRPRRKVSKKVPGPCMHVHVTLLNSNKDILATIIQKLLTLISFSTGLTIIFALKNLLYVCHIVVFSKISKTKNGDHLIKVSDAYCTKTPRRLKLSARAIFVARDPQKANLAAVTWLSDHSYL